MPATSCAHRGPAAPGARDRRRTRATCWAATNLANHNTALPVGLALDVNQRCHAQDSQRGALPTLYAAEELTGVTFPERLRVRRTSEPAARAVP
ncbi:hypothetical protein [Streptomyces sp. TRM68367]|uniref:hypothetical protein n=1 Tax=Streptomyces sp. TRM68367 TaxID=2758415 RepID=UPI00165B0938|nr:hypothetical protein [Streptomyces sp. TRM68367]MBC9729423.1 hypothetical protein [Streptomyces sp. TRM68367]